MKAIVDKLRNKVKKKNLLEPVVDDGLTDYNEWIYKLEYVGMPRNYPNPKEWEDFEKKRKQLQGEEWEEYLNARRKGGRRRSSSKRRHHKNSRNRSRTRKGRKSHRKTFTTRKSPKKHARRSKKIGGKQGQKRKATDTAHG